jgi:hypothetical protein
LPTMRCLLPAIIAAPGRIERADDSLRWSDRMNLRMPRVIVT